MLEQEGHMAKPIQSKPILDRRQLLTTAAAMATSGILPNTERAEAGQTAEAVMPSAPELDARPLNVCATTARRIEEIVARNRIRQEARLPLLAIPKELRRMKEAADRAKFEAFAHVHGDAVLAEVLGSKRKAIREPYWLPRGWLGLALQAQVNKVLRRRFVQIGPPKVSTASSGREYQGTT
jgi:hypothetical protein